MAASQPMEKIVPYSRVYVYTMTSAADFLRVIGVGVGVLRSLLQGEGMKSQWLEVENAGRP